MTCFKEKKTGLHGREKKNLYSWRSPIPVLGRPDTVNFSDMTKTGVFSVVWS